MKLAGWCGTLVITGISIWLSPVAGLIGIPVAACVAISRMFFGLHYPSDVVVGAGAGVILTTGAAVWLWFAQQWWIPMMVLVGSWAAGPLAWLALRHRGGPLRWGQAGGGLGCTETTFFVASVSRWSGRVTEPVSSWPRADVTLVRSEPVGQRRLLTVRFGGSDQTAHLEIRGRHKEAVVALLFRPVRGAGAS